MREKYESLALMQLKELAKVRGLKGTSTMKKAELVEAMLAEDERLKKEQEKNSSRDATSTEAPPRKPVPQNRPAPAREGNPRDNANGTRETSSRENAPRGNDTYDEGQYPRELDSGEEPSGIL